MARDSTEFLGGSSHDALARFPKCAQALERDFVLDTVVGRYEVLVHRNTQDVMLGRLPRPED